MIFSSIIGQKEARSRLGAALQGTPGHAYIFTGPDGIGKTTMACAFAKALLCHDPNPDGACGHCMSCRHFTNGVHPDFRHLQLEDKDKVIKVERIRQDVSGDLYLRPQFGPRKVYLIDADSLNEQGQNALLKSLEEPPEYAVFLLTIIGPERLLPTILSRSVLIALRRHEPAEIEEILAANGFSGDEIRFYARFAGGLPGVAMDLAGSGWFSDLRQETMQFYQNLGSQSRTTLLTAGYQFFESNKPHVPVILDILGSLVRDQLILSCAADRSLLTNQDQLPLLGKAGAAKAPPGEARQRLVRSYAALLGARRGLSLNVSFESLICNLLLCLRKEFVYA